MCVCQIPLYGGIWTLKPNYVCACVSVKATTVKPLVKLLHVRRYQPKKPTISEIVHEKVMDQVGAGIDAITGEYGDHVSDVMPQTAHGF